MLGDRPCFGVRNEARLADIAVAANEVEGAPLLAAFDPSASTVWWSDAPVAEADFHLADMPVQCLFLRFPTRNRNTPWFGEGDAVTVIFGTAQGAADAVVTAPITPDPYTGCFALWLDEPVRAPWARVSYASSTALAIATDYLSLTPVFQPALSFQVGTRDGATSLATVSRTLFGSTFATARGQLRERSAAWDVWSGRYPGELAAFRDMRDRLGQTEPFVWTRSPVADQGETYLARFTSPPSATDQGAGNHVVSLALQEYR